MQTGDTALGMAPAVGDFSPLTDGKSGEETPLNPFPPVYGPIGSDPGKR